MRDASPPSAPSFSETTDSSCTSIIPLAHISVKLVKAFVQPDGSHGNGAGVVLLPGVTHTEIEHGNSTSRALGISNRRFPSNNDCQKIAKRVGLPETSFVLFPKENGWSSRENRSILEERKDNVNIGNGSNEKADFHVKWYTPECEVDMCGHATIALAGYIYSIMKGRANTDTNANCDVGTRQQNRYFWRMQCKAGLLGIEVAKGSSKSIDGIDHSNGNNAQNRESNQRNNHALDSLPRVVMEQAIPEFCGSIDFNEIAASLSIQAEGDLAITITDDNSEENNTSKSENIEQVFPFPHCEVVSTGGRDLMIPVRSTVLNEMGILDNGRYNSGGDDNKRDQLCRSINVVSKRYDIVGYHLFEVDDNLFRSKHDSDSENEPPVEMKSSSQRDRNGGIIEGNDIDEDCPIHLNELIRIFQIANEEGGSKVQSCLEAVGIKEDRWYGNEETMKSQHDNIDKETRIPTVPSVRKSRTILVSGVRNFAPSVGIPEEPATGSANGALACYLVKYFFLDACCRSDSSNSNNLKHRDNGHSLDNPVCFRFCMEQGRAMGEPCLIDAEIEVVNGTIRKVKVGGLVNVTGETLDLDLTST